MAGESNNVWLLPNFGAEEGLAFRDAIQAPTVRTVARLWKILFGRSAQVLGLAGDSDVTAIAASKPVFDWLPEAHTGIAWLPTASAHQELRGLGVPPWGPSPAVVERTHDKAFARRACAQLGVDVSPAARLFDILDPHDFRDRERLATRILRVLESWPAWARQRWTLKPRFGAAGRGRVPGFGFAILSPQLNGSLGRFADCGGAVLEPFLDRVVDVSAQFVIHGPAKFELLGTMRQDLTVSGSYVGHQGRLQDGTVSSACDFEDELIQTSSVLVERASEEGLIGPCGVDAFAFRLGDRIFFRPCVELNARFTVATVVIGLVRRLLAAKPLLPSVLDWRFQLDGAAAERRNVASTACQFTLDAAHLQMEIA